MTRSSSYRAASVRTLCILAAAAVSAAFTGHDERQGRRDVIVVANRGAGSITVIDAATARVRGTHPLPAGPSVPEPMYVVDAGRSRVLVGDRANSRVVVFDRRTFAAIGTIPTGAGVWHMWAGGGRLWINNDIDRTGTVVDLDTLTVVATVPMPADLVAFGGRPHDVVLDPHHGRYAYVTILGVSGPSDYVVKFSLTTYEEVARAAVGKDPHVSIDHRYEQIFVPCQGSSIVHVLDAASLDELAAVDVPGAHGAEMLARRERFYTTNFPGGGVDALFTFDTRTRTIVGEPVDAPLPSPHNIASTRDGRVLYVTHSGPALSEVSVYRTGPKGLRLAATVHVGLNPFGIALVR